MAASPVDLVLIAHGWLSDQQSCQDDLALCRESLEVNAVSPVLFAEAFARHFAKANHGTIAFLGSVAGDRGRKVNYTYGASKGFVARYAEGMQHRFAGSGVKIVLIKPGPTDTPMTAAQKAQGKSAGPGRSGRARDGQRHPAWPTDGLHTGDLVADHADRAPHPALRLQPALDLRRKLSLPNASVPLAHGHERQRDARGPREHEMTTRASPRLPSRPSWP